MKRLTILLFLLMVSLAFAQTPAPTPVPYPSPPVPGNELTTLTILPSSPQIHVGDLLLLQAQGHYKDGTTQIPMSVTWSSSKNAVAQVSNYGGSTVGGHSAPLSGSSANDYQDEPRGTAQAISVGTTTVTAVLGAISGSTVMTVVAQVVPTPTPTVVPTPTATPTP